MHVEATTTGPLATDADTIAVFVFEDEGVAHDVPGGALGALLDSGEAARAFRRIAHTHAEGRRFIVLGLGARAELDPERARVAAAVVGERARELRSDTLCLEVPHHVSEAIVAGLVEGTLLHAYRFDRFRSLGDESTIDRVLVSAHHDVSEAVRRASVITSAQNRARDLGNTPANELTPDALGEYAIRTAGGVEGLSVTVMDEAQIRTEGMGALTAVAQGSSQSARLIRLRYEGGGENAGGLALVGKAITFDSGGLSLKSAARMHEMKFDMAGGAAVIEAIVALAELGAPGHVLGVVGATENLPSGSALKPSDIIRAMDGTTIEVDNTDAEGRLVLADCLTYAIREGCDRLIDIATLTGGVVSALGSTYAGLMSNHDALAELVQGCGASTGERVWRLPLDPEYAQMVKGRHAELTNRSERREAFAITAAEFLHRFVRDTPWAHLDIAGTAYDVRRPYFADNGATGFGVRLLVELGLRSGQGA